MRCVSRFRISTHAFLFVALLGFSPALNGRASAEPTEDRSRCRASQVDIVLDVGHTPESPGATSARGTSEFVFNNGLAEDSERALRKAGFRTVVLHEHGKGRDQLKKRVETTNQVAPAIFLSIHHDSVQPRYLRSWNVDGAAQRYSDDFSGYSIFVAGPSPWSDRSVEFSTLLAEALIRYSMHPSLHHAIPIPGEGRLLLNERLGIYSNNGLYVLRNAHVPSVLLEAGLIVNRNDELKLQSQSTRSAIAASIVDAVHTFCDKAN